MKRIKYLIPLVALLFFSCEDYLGDNINPNAPSPDQVTPNLQLATAQTASYREISRNMNRLGNFFMNNWGINVNSFAATNPQEYSLQLDNNFYTSIWDNTMLNTSNFTSIINHPAANYDNHKAIAMIMKSYYFQYLVDIYGDIPYFQIHRGSENLTPAYDDDQVVYRALYDQLDEAIMMIDNASASVNAVGSEDVIFAGDMDSWKRLANTIKLRLLLRQSDMTDADTMTYLNDKFTNDLATAQFLNSDATINPGYSSSTAERQNPFYNLMYETNDAEKDAHRYFRASKYMGDLLNNTGDPRRGLIFQTFSGQVQGVIQGDVSQNGGGTAPASISALGAGIVVDHSQDGYIMTYAESLFLQAEAAHKGYLGGNPQALFDMAIEASCNQLGTTEGGYVGYINTQVGKGYAVGTPAQKVEAIMYQKNIALQGSVNAMESFIEYTRTGLIDNIPMATGSTKPNKPRRLLYPTSEYVGNSANVPAQGDIYSEGPFWFNH